jgi:glucose-6-phosphate isomerase
MFCTDDRRRANRPHLFSKDVQKLVALAGTANLRGKIDAMFAGEHINITEDRAVLHTALRASRTQVVEDEGNNIVPDVWKVLDSIKAFSKKVRSGEWLGYTGKPLKNVVCVGIGGSYLGPLFVHTALATDQSAMQGAAGRVLRFLANVDPIDVAKALKGVLRAVPYFAACVSIFGCIWCLASCMLGGIEHDACFSKCTLHRLTRVCRVIRGRPGTPVGMHDHWTDT